MFDIRIAARSRRRLPADARRGGPDLRRTRPTGRRPGPAPSRPAVSGGATWSVCTCRTTPPGSSPSWAPGGAAARSPPVERCRRPRRRPGVSNWSGPGSSWPPTTSRHRRAGRSSACRARGRGPAEPVGPAPPWSRRQLPPRAAGARRPGRRVLHLRHHRRGQAHRPHPSDAGGRAADDGCRLRRTPEFRPRTAPPDKPPGLSFNPFGHMAGLGRMIFRLYVGRTFCSCRSSTWA